MGQANLPKMTTEVFSSFFKKKFLYLCLAVSGLSCGMQDLSLWNVGFSLVEACGLICPVVCGNPSFLTRDQTCIPYIGRQILNHWTIREVPSVFSRWDVLCGALGPTPSYLPSVPSLPPSLPEPSILSKQKAHAAQVPSTIIQGP